MTDPTPPIDIPDDHPQPTPDIDPAPAYQPEIQPDRTPQEMPQYGDGNREMAGVPLGTAASDMFDAAG